jgi:hypothetical protein
VNVLEDPNGMAELQKLGLRSVPVLSRGDKYTFGQSTKQIVDFLGLNEKSGPELTTDELAARVTKFMDAALELIPLMPQDRLGTHVPGRPRSYRTLAFHLFRVVDAFLDANEEVTLVQDMFREEPKPNADTDALVAYGDKVRHRFREWWEKSDTAPSKTLPTYYGPQSLHELMERTTWHCGQHVRQYMMLLEKEGVSHNRPLVAADFAKLPMPQNVWDG